MKNTIIAACLVLLGILIFFGIWYLTGGKNPPYERFLLITILIHLYRKDLDGRN